MICKVAYCNPDTWDYFYMNDEGVFNLRTSRWIPSCSLPVPLFDRYQDNYTGYVSFNRSIQVVVNTVPDEYQTFFDRPIYEQRYDDSDDEWAFWRDLSNGQD